MEKYPYKKEGERLKELINQKGLSIYKFAKLTYYSDSRIYRLINGECSIMTVEVRNACLFAQALGYKSLNDFLNAMNIDILNNIR